MNPRRQNFDYDLGWFIYLLLAGGLAFSFVL
jgi:hypothetical protein